MTDRADDLPPDPMRDLAAVLGAALATAGADRDELFTVCGQVIQGGQAMKVRLGCLVAHVTICAPQVTGPTPPRPAPDPIEAAHAAFDPPTEAPE